MAGNENSGERLFVTITNKGPVRRYVDGVLVLETDDNYSVLANCVDPQGVAALLDRCRQHFLTAAANVSLEHQQMTCKLWTVMLPH